MRISTSVRNVLIVGLALAMTAACESGGGGAKTDKVQLTFAMFDATQAPALHQIIDTFEKTHPNVSVSLQTTPRNQFPTKLRTALAAGKGPDIFWISPNDFPYFAKGGQLAALDGYLKALPAGEVESFPPTTLEGLKWSGKQMALPRGAATVGLFYNKKLFDAAGVAYPTDAWKWDDLMQAAKKISNPSKRVWGVAADLDDPQKSYYNTIYQAGGDVLAQDKKSSRLGDPASIQGLEYWVNLIKSGAMPPYKQMLATAPLAMFQSGQVAMLYEGSFNTGLLASAEGVKDVIDVAPMPAGPAGPGTTLVSVGNAMNAATKHPEQAWEFLKFLSFKEGATITAKAGVAVQPPIPEAAKIWVEHYPKYHAQIFVDAESYGRPWPSTTTTAAWLKALTTDLAPAWSLEVDVATAAKKAKDDMNAVLTTEN